MEKRIIVLGKNYSTVLGAVRSLGEAGIPADVFFVTSGKQRFSIAGRSRYVFSYTEQVGREDEEIIRQIVSRWAGNPGKKLLMPTDDYSAALIDRHYRTLSRDFVLPHTAGEGDGEIVRLMSKAVQGELARAAGLKTARSWRVCLQEPAEIPGDIVYPCFVKPESSFLGGKRGMMKCVSEAELEKELALLRAQQVPEVLVQEYIEIEEEYSISGICLGERVFLPALLRKIRVAEAHKGVTVFGRIEEIRNLGEALEPLERMLAGIRFYGIIDVEVFRKGREFYFNEINFRTSAVCYAVTAGGVNIPAFCCRAMLQEGDEFPEATVAYGKKFLCEKAAWDDYIDGKLTAKELHRMYREADYFIIRNAEDPEPEKWFLRKARVRKITRLAGSWVRRA